MPDHKRKYEDLTPLNARLTNLKSGDEFASGMGTQKGFLNVTTNGATLKSPAACDEAEHMLHKHSPIEIRNVIGGTDLDDVRSLLRAYTAFLAASTSPGKIDLGRRLAELIDLPGTNTPPSGALLLAIANGKSLGCVAFGPVTLPSGEIVAELRRMWVSPEARSNSIGRALIMEAISRARSASYTAIYLDCLYAVMPAAIKLYKSVGFRPTDRYKHDHSVEETIFLRLDLDQPTATAPTSNYAREG